MKENAIEKMQFLPHRSIFSRESFQCPTQYNISGKIFHHFVFAGNFNNNSLWIE